jgi:hypothetical protein
VIALLTDISVLAHLKASEAEVDHIFDHPLEAVLDPGLASKESLVAIGSEDWPYDVEFHVSRYNSYVQNVLNVYSEFVGYTYTMARRCPLSHASFPQHSFPCERTYS